MDENQARLCKCNEWETWMPQIIGAQVLAHYHGSGYNGAPFRYCPWCGSELIPNADYWDSEMLWREEEHDE